LETSKVLQVHKGQQEQPAQPQLSLDQQARKGLLDLLEQPVQRVPSLDRPVRRVQLVQLVQLALQAQLLDQLVRKEFKE
jgi:hypothetical protein